MCLLYKFVVSIVLGTPLLPYSGYKPELEPGKKHFYIFYLSNSNKKIQPIRKLYQKV